jgi:uncharacterized protein YkwD
MAARSDRPMSDLTQTVLSVLDAYIQQFRPELTETLLYQVVKQIIPKLGSPELLEAEAKQLAQRVIAEYHQGYVPSVSPDEKAKEIAAQVNEEIAQFRAEHAAILGDVKVTQPQMLNDLELSSRIEKEATP